MPIFKKKVKGKAAAQASKDFWTDQAKAEHAIRVRGGRPATMGDLDRLNRNI